MTNLKKNWLKVLMNKIFIKIKFIQTIFKVKIFITNIMINNKILKIIILIKKKFNQNQKVQHFIMENKIIYQIKMMNLKINNKIIKRSHIQ